MKDDKDRLSCFDKAAATRTTAGVPSGPETANTKEIVTNFSPNDFKVVDPDDLHVAPGRLIGKPIEIRNVICLYARDGYRCIAARRRTMIAVVFAKSVDPAAERETLESNCGAIERIESPTCQRDIRIIPTDYCEDPLNAVAKRIVLRAEKLEIQPTSRPKR
ncbi:hypothetical protein GCM10007857_63510 [Bradyrhizobium iriomotense]|uniref:Uncharacterized protein n=1 Tax=Bradyrhizobium iriomotense TaxID=441950 RepID=A0ABQ6B5I4_9BRAD|nr:hypothetical protein GCM10007857_63510 [Bradyrhizobium iriomotense]